MPSMTAVKRLYRERKSMQGAVGPNPFGSGIRSAGDATPRGAGLTFGAGFTFRGQPILSPFHGHAHHEPAHNDGKWCLISADRVRG